MLGIAALGMPFASSFAVGIYLGCALIASGVFGIVAALRTARFRGHGLDAMLGVISVAAGFVVLAHPFAGALAVLWAIGVWLAVSGGAKLIMGMRTKHERVALFATGTLDIVLAIFFVLGFVTRDLLLVATVAGISLIVGGMASLAIAMRLPAHT